LIRSELTLPVLSVNPERNVHIIDYPMYSPNIQIKLKDLYVFYNRKDPAQTKRLYAQLQAQIQK